MDANELSREILLSRCRMLLDAYVERFGSNPFVNYKLEELPTDQLKSIGHHLHEALYAPPSRSR